MDRYPQMTKPKFPESVPELTEKEAMEHKNETIQAIEGAKNNLNCNNPHVNPSHYQHLPNGLQTIDIIEAWTKDLDGVEGYNTGNIIKYVSRWKYKNGIEDLEKAKWYLEELINYENKKTMEEHSC